jgi:hypothetical protein
MRRDFQVPIEKARMWHTPTGTRYLQGAEALLVKTAIGVMVDSIEEEIRHPDNSWACGVRIFDSMDARQRLALLATVTNALLRPDVPELPLNAINEGAIAAICESLPVYVEIEIDGEDSDGRITRKWICIPGDV